LDHPLFARGPFTERRCEGAPSGRPDQIFPAARGQLEIFERYAIRAVRVGLSDTTVQVREAIGSVTVYRAASGSVTWCVWPNDPKSMDEIRQIRFEQWRPGIFGYWIGGTFETSNPLHHGLITLRLWPTGGLRDYWLEARNDDVPWD
jgi:hypothetical protein